MLSNGLRPSRKPKQLLSPNKILSAFLSKKSNFHNVSFIPKKKNIEFIVKNEKIKHDKRAL